MTSDCTIKFSHFIPTRYIDANNLLRLYFTSYFV